MTEKKIYHTPERRRVIGNTLTSKSEGGKNAIVVLSGWELQYIIQSMNAYGWKDEALVLRDDLMKLHQEVFDNNLSSQ